MINFMEPWNAIFLQNCGAVFLSVWLPFSMKIGGRLANILKRIQREYAIGGGIGRKIAGMKALPLFFLDIFVMGQRKYTTIQFLGFKDISHFISFL